ncbi:hypothetical protein TPS_03572 [Trichinella pseudospiralis]
MNIIIVLHGEYHRFWSYSLLQSVTIRKHDPDKLSESAILINIVMTTRATATAIAMTAFSFSWLKCAKRLIATCNTTGSTITSIRFTTMHRGIVE